MNTKVLILFSFTALVMFSQYALPNSFADNSGASDLNATSSAIPSVPVKSVSDSPAPVTDQSSSNASSDSSASTPVPVQSVSATTSSIPPVIDQSSSNASSDSSTVVQAVATQAVPVQEVSDTVPSIPPAANQSSSDISSGPSTVPSVPVTPSQPVSTPVTPVQPTSTPVVPSNPVISSSPVVPSHSTPTQKFNGTMPSHPSQIPSGWRFNSTLTQSHVYDHVPSVSSPSLQSISGQWANNKIGDSAFIQNMQHFISLGNYASGTPIPQWVKDNAMMLYKGQIDEKTFEAGIHDWISSYHQAVYQSRSPSYTPQYQQYISSPVPQSTNTAIVLNSASSHYGDAITVTASVTDAAGSVSTGTISWNDGGVGGTFSSTTCTLYSASCTVSYTPSVNSPSAVAITGNYEGDSTHQSSSGSSDLTVNGVHSTVTTIAPNPVTIYSNEPVSLTATVSDPSISPNAITGTVSWSDNGAGGSFSEMYCYTPSENCETSYTPNPSYSGTVLVTANYGGDDVHSASSGTASLTSQSSVTLASYTTSNIQTDKSSYNPGNTVSITVNPEGAQVGQNVAILVTDPSSNIVASRTVQVDAQGSSVLQIGLSPDAQAGTYQVTASALVNGNYLSYHAQFTVSASGTSQSSGIAIVSAQPTDQLGDKTVTSFSRGTTSYAKVVLSSNSTQTALVTVNLVGSDGTSLGVGSVKTSLGAGNSEMEVSFYIPSTASVGTGNIYVDTYTDWPSNGGVPLTGETSSSVSVG
ncbi:MAG: hypothetical protein KGI19_01035 [Thaumarchaeota archaeon]|nr:hypothetical protein [Nitrososphaerota archaeon]